MSECTSQSDQQRGYYTLAARADACRENDCFVHTVTMRSGIAFAGKDMVGALGAEIDRLEAEIRQVVPGIRHIDLVRHLAVLQQRKVLDMMSLASIEIYSGSDILKVCCLYSHSSLPSECKPRSFAPGSPCQRLSLLAWGRCRKPTGGGMIRMLHPQLACIPWRLTQSSSVSVDWGMCNSFSFHQHITYLFTVSRSRK